MPSYIQIEGDPTKWWLPQPVQASQLTGQPLSLQVSAPVMGNLFLSGKAASVAVFDLPSGQVPGNVNVSAASLYVPTAAGASVGHSGYGLSSAIDLDDLPNQIMASMQRGHIQTVALSGGGTLVINGATLSFAVLVMQYPPMVGGSRTGN
jgi:hypothetical protein